MGGPDDGTEMTVHFFQYGHAACMKPGLPAEWEADHRWSSDWKDVSCPDCLRGREPVETFIVAADGKSITCKRCKRTSHNAKDVEHLYCGFCDVYHDMLWPPARQWWIDHPDLVGCSYCGGYSAHQPACPRRAVPVPHVR